MRALYGNLGECELFAGIPHAALQRLSLLAEQIEVPAGQVLFRMGDQADRMYAVVRGRVQLALPLLIDDCSQEVTVDEKVPPQLLGWSALVPPYRSTMTARTLVDSELFAFEGEKLRHALHKEPEVGLLMMSNLAAVMARRFHQAQALWMRELSRAIESQRF